MTGSRGFASLWGCRTGLVKPFRSKTLPGRYQISRVFMLRNERVAALPMVVLRTVNLPHGSFLMLGRHGDAQTVDRSDRNNHQHRAKGPLAARSWTSAARSIPSLFPTAPNARAHAFTGGAGDAGGTLRGSGIRDLMQSTSMFFARPSGLLSSSLEPLCNRRAGSPGP